MTPNVNFTSVERHPDGFHHLDLMQIVEDVQNFTQRASPALTISKQGRWSTAAPNNAVLSCPPQSHLDSCNANMSKDGHMIAGRSYTPHVTSATPNV